jgi:hypothetical protein
MIGDYFEAQTTIHRKRVGRKNRFSVTARNEITFIPLPITRQWVLFSACLLANPSLNIQMTREE